MTVDHTDVHPGGRYLGARGEAMTLPTRRLERVERSYRADVTSGRHLGRTAKTAWMATRDELRRRGRPVPPADQSPRRWRR